MKFDARKVLIKSIYNNVKNMYELDILDPSEDKKLSVLEESCKEFLVYMGYKVFDSELYQVNVKKQNDLIDLFYHYKNYYHPKEYNTGRMPVERDRAIAKLFVISRTQNETVSKKTALQECAKIIETVFIYEDKFKFNTPIAFSMFGQNKMGWITEMALKIIEYEKASKDERERDDAIREYEKTYMETERNVPLGNLDDILERVKSNA